MAKKLDQIIVVDIESTCWQESEPADRESEFGQAKETTLGVKLKDNASLLKLVILLMRYSKGLRDVYLATL